VKRLFFTTALLTINLALISSVNAEINYCEDLFKNGKYDQTVEACTTELRNTDSKDTQAHAYYYRGRAYEQKGDSEKAFADLTKALELNSKLYPANISLGMIYYHRGSFDKAIAEYNKALELQPERLFLCALYTNRGNAFASQGHIDEAIADFSKCIESSTKNDSLARAYAMRGTAYLSKKEYDRSILDCSKAIELDSKFTAAYNQRGLAFHSKGKYDQAVADFSKAIDLEPKGMYVYASYANRGNSLKAQGKYELAIFDYKRAIELKEKIPNTHYNMACAYALANKTHEACLSLQKAIANGYSNWGKIKTDSELGNLHDSPCYKSILHGE